MNLFSPRIVNVGLRGSSLAMRTLFLFGLAYAFSPADVGSFGLLVALVATLTSLVSFDFYAVVIRQSPDSPDAPAAASSYVAVVLATGIVGVLLMLANMAAAAIPPAHWAALALLFVVEHWCHESYRILEGRNRVLAASLSLFLRSAAWPILCVLVYLTIPAATGLSVYAVFYVWLAFSVVTALIFVPRALALLGRPKLRVSFAAVAMHARAAGRMFLATLLHRLLFYLDRLLIGAAFGAAFLGVYTFYFTFFGGILALLDAAIFSFIYPQLIAFANSGDRAGFQRIVARLSKELWIAATLTAVVCLGILAVAILVPQFSEYQEQSWMAGLVFASCVLVMLSYQHHYALFALRRDAELVVANALGMSALLATILIGFLAGRAEIAACGIPLAGATMLVAKRKFAHAALRAEAA